MKNGENKKIKRGGKNNKNIWRIVAKQQALYQKGVTYSVRTIELLYNTIICMTC